ncbi:glycoside hydrolase family 97 protein [Seonamhaeicola sp.]|uniref:glycoside hydrolase family 97 protein n=1 Tax=Seonamhaeicola sp. TaxID=1912245 RepID=UPI0026077D51|nr:glycoside hydrolase family 97 protein [Seonamhaeicola sp.]
MNIRKLVRILFLMASVIIQGCIEKPDSAIFLNSPDGKVSLELNSESGALKYRLSWQGELMLDSSVLSLLPDHQFTVKSISTRSVNETWKPVWGQFSSIKDQYNETIVTLDFKGGEARLLCRAYNNGVAFRFETGGHQTTNKAIYRCDFNLPSDSEIYYPSGEKEPIGPIAIGDVTEKVKLPVVVEHSSGKHMSLLESDLYSAPGFKVMDFQINQDLLYSSNQVETATGQIVTPWRVVLLEENIGELVTNTVPLNLAAPNQLEDVSWIKPGKTLWDWRVHGYVAPDGFKYGINTESYLRFIDFAAENGIEYFLIDDAWYTQVSEGKITHSDKLDLPKVNQYAKQKGVDLILYYDRRHGSYGDKALFDHYQDLGMKGIKYGFMNDNVPFTRSAIELSAKSKLLIDFHDGPVPFTGISRTLPNAITREYCHAQQDSRRAFTPETFIKMALINAVQGPLDMNNGNFDITGIDAGKRRKGPKEVNTYLSTVAAEAARTLIIHSGLVCLPDAPEAYEAKSDLFEFIQKQPVGKWDESIVLHGKIGEYISTARRQGEQWFIGSVASQVGATLDIQLDFLKPGKEYKVTYYEDAEKTHCDTNPEAYRIRKGILKKGEIIKAVMAPGGGHCMWVRPK